MGWLDRVINVFRPARLSRELEREISFHIAEATDRLIEGGMSPEAAAREAARRFGHRPVLTERIRDMDVATWLESLLADLRYAVRALRSSPGFTLTALLSLGLGIGANTAIYSLVDAVILKPLPVARPDQLVKLAMGDTRNDVFTNPLWEAIRDRGDALDGLFAFGSDRFDLAPSGQARMAEGDLVSGGFFSTLGVQPALGRLLQDSDDRRGCPSLAVVSYGFWQREYGGRPDVVGRRLTLNRRPFTIIGVTGPEFTGVEVGRVPQVYVPLCSEPVIHGAPGMLDERSAWWLQLIGRLPEGATVAHATARLAAAAPGIFAATLPDNWGEPGRREYLKNTLAAYPAATGFSDVRQRYHTALAVLMGVVGVVLLIACANVANLLLARAAVREQEIAMRLAIGASRGRVVRQVLTESILLSTLGAGLGLLFARWSSGLLVGMIGDAGAPVSLDLSLDLRLLGFSLLVAVGTGILFGVAPAWRSITVRPHAALKSGGAATTSTRASLAGGRILVVTQVALALVLVATAGLLLGTFRTLTTIDPGFRPDGVLLASLDFGSLDLPEPERQVAGRELLEKLRATPGVLAASGAVLTPVSGRRWNGFVDVAGYQPTGETDNLVWFNGVTDGYFSTLGTAVLAGRDFTARDDARAPRVAIINRSLARKFFGSANPVGRRFQMRGGDEQATSVEVVGLVADAMYRSLRDTLSPTVYVPWTQAEHFGSLTYEVRIQGSTSDAVAGILRAAKAVLPNASFEIRSLSGQLAASLARERLLATLSGFFGGLALLLALIGLYGTMAYNVTRRRKEIGIRVALGATRVRLVRLVAGQAGRMILAGLVLGGAGTVAATRLVRSFLFGRSPLDPVTLILATALVAIVALAAGAMPAIRAVRQDPQAVLREE